MLRPQLAEVKSQIEKLGPPPSGGQPPKSPTVAAERARLNTLAAALDGAVKTSELAWVRAKQLIDRITTMRYQLFTRNLFERKASPMLPGLWRDVDSRMPSVISRVGYYGGDWMNWARRKSSEVTMVLAGAAALFAVLFWAVRGFIARRRAAFQGIPNFFERVREIGWMAPARMLAPFAAAIALYAGFDAIEMIFSPWGEFGTTLLKGLLIFSAAAVVLSCLLAPRQPHWRLIPLADSSARRVLWLAIAFVGVYVVDTLLVEFGRAIYVPLTVTVAQSFLTSLVFAALLALLLLTPFVPQVGPLRPVNHLSREEGAIAPAVSRLAPRWIKIPLWMVAIAIAASSMIGYVALGRFIAHQLVLTGLILVVAGVGYLAIRAMTRARADGQTELGAALQSRFHLDTARQGQLARLVEVAATFALGLVALPALMLQWGFSSADIRDWSKSLLFGFEIGSFKISLVRILIGIALFIALLFVTRLVQRWLRERVMTQGRMDSGIANSIENLIGYAGTAVAAIVAVSYAGFDVTNLAIVAGALSVGIGFGLQSIVSNFVSGLILLIERPIKVGDWIVVGGDQGYVRRIAVRATEIETFDRASLIVPNSELIGGRVLNWTHRNLLGRQHIKITTGRDWAPETILKIMRDCANANPLVLKTPEPSASLDSFSDGALEYSLRVTVADVNRGGSVQNELRLAILNAFKAQGIFAPSLPQPVTVPEVEVIEVAAMGQAAAAVAAHDAGHTHAHTPSHTQGTGQRSLAEKNSRSRAPPRRRRVTGGGAAGEDDGVDVGVWGAKGYRRVSQVFRVRRHDRGDFVFVPPHMPHVEVNLSTTEDLVWLTCRTPDNIVVNLADVDDATLAGYRRA